MSFQELKIILTKDILDKALVRSILKYVDECHKIGLSTSEILEHFEQKNG